VPLEDNLEETILDAAPQAENAQAAVWNGLAGRNWIEMQESLDRLFKPFEDVLVEEVSLCHARRVLDVGCGPGTTTLAVARLPWVKGRSTGIDISEPMIGAARARAEREGSPARFICANAQSYPFEPGSFDTIISRFGVMFFDDPIAAFANLRSAATDHTELRLVVWRSPAENHFMTTAERAAAPLLPKLPVRRPDEPGPFALSDDRRVRTILEESGWTQIELRPVDVDCTLPETELIPYLSRLGPVGRMLSEMDERTRALIIDTVRPAFDRFVHGSEVRFTAACWMVSGRATMRRSRG